MYCIEACCIQVSERKYAIWNAASLRHLGSSPSDLARLSNTLWMVPFTSFKRNTALVCRKSRFWVSLDMRALRSLRMHICPSIREYVCVSLCGDPSENNIWFHPHATHLQPVQPRGQTSQRFWSTFPPATKTPLDNYLLSLTGGDIIRLSSTPNIPLALKCSLT